MKHYLILLFFYLIVINSVSSQTFKYDKYGYVSDPEFHQLIKNRKYTLVSAFDTISKSPLEIVAKVIKDNKMYFLDCNGMELPYRDILAISIIQREKELNQKFFDLQRNYENYTRTEDINYESFKKDNLYGLRRKKDGKEVIEAKYNSIWCYQDGIVALEQNNLHGVSDTSGKIIVPIKYDNILLCMIDSLIVDYFIGYKNGLAALINKKGTELFPPSFTAISPYTVNGMLTCTLRTNGKITRGLIDSKGKIIIEPKYSNLSLIHNSNLFRTELDGNNYLYGLINKQGKLIFDLKLNSVGTSCDGKKIQIQQDKKFGFVDIDGNIMMKPIYEEINTKDIPPDLIIVGKKQGENSLKYGVATYTNKLIIPIEYDRIVASSDYFLCKKGMKYYSIDLNGKLSKVMDYKDIQIISSREAIATDTSGKTGVIHIDAKGTDIVKIPFSYMPINSYGSGYFSTQQGIINLENELVVKKKWDDVTWTNKLPLRAKGIFTVKAMGRYCIDRYGNMYAEKDFKE
jgi:hypothetical protein